MSVSMCVSFFKCGFILVLLQNLACVFQFVCSVIFVLLAVLCN